MWIRDYFREGQCFYTDVKDSLSFHCFVWALSPVIGNGTYSNVSIFLSCSSCIFLSTRFSAFPFSPALQCHLSFFWVSGLFWEVGGFYTWERQCNSFLKPEGQNALLTWTLKKFWKTLHATQSAAFWCTVNVRFFRTVTDGWPNCQEMILELHSNLWKVSHLPFFSRTWREFTM